MKLEPVVAEAFHSGPEAQNRNNSFHQLAGPKLAFAGSLAH